MQCLPGRYGIDYGLKVKEKECFFIKPTADFSLNARGDDAGLEILLLCNLGVVVSNLKHGQSTV